MSDNSFVSEFQIVKNKVLEFSIVQSDLIQIKSSINIDFNISDTDMEILETEDKYIGKVCVVVKLDGNYEDERVFSINLKMQGVFTENNQLTDKEKFKSMLELNGVVTLIQLCRAYINCTTALSGMKAPINFPMVNVVELKKSQKND